MSGGRRAITDRWAFRRTEFRRNGVANPAQGGKHAQECERTTVDHLLPIDVNGELAVVSLDELGVNAELSAQEGRRPGGLNR